ncbi:MAG: glutamate ligase domain-containing protein, partial [Planctomycetota bacterium]
VVIGSLDSPPAAEIVKKFKGRGETFSLTHEADWRARNIEIREGRWTFEVVKYGKTLGRVHLTVPGNHNVANTLAAIAAANWAGVGQEIIMLSVDEYEGSERRMQVIGKTNGSIVMDDYAHHPTEVQATLKALRERYPDKKLWVVFQPHLYSRTRQFLKDFARSFGDADLVLLTDVYAARDADEKRKINSDALAKLVDEHGKAALYLPSFDEVERFLKDKMPPDSVVVTMGAGDIGEVAHRLVR